MKKALSGLVTAVEDEKRTWPYSINVREALATAHDALERA